MIKRIEAITKEINKELELNDLRSRRIYSEAIDILRDLEDYGIGLYDEFEEEEGYLFYSYDELHTLIKEIWDIERTINETKELEPFCGVTGGYFLKGHNYKDTFKLLLKYLDKAHACYSINEMMEKK